MLEGFGRTPGIRSDGSPLFPHEPQFPERAVDETGEQTGAAGLDLEELVERHRSDPGIVYEAMGGSEAIEEVAQPRGNYFTYIQGLVARVQVEGMNALSAAEEDDLDEAVDLKFVDPLELRTRRTDA